MPNQSSQCDKSNFAHGEDGIIGFFDSGVGGLSIWREAVRRIPSESTIYLADSANCPYGSRDCDFVLSRSIWCTEYLINSGAKLIVVACNTATAAAIDFLRSHYNLPFVGLEPAVKPAAIGSKSGLVGVLATEGTLAGRLFKETSSKLANDVQVIVRKVNGWVESVEAGEIKPTKDILTMVEREVRPLLDAGVDSIVLGCTHFPFLREAIEIVAGSNVRLYDPADAVARQIEHLLTSHDVATPQALNAKHRFISTLDGDNFCSRIAKLGISDESYIFL